MSNFDFLHAARNGNTKKLQNCLKRGSNVNYQNLNGYTALHFAVKHNRTENVKLLIDAGIDLNIQAQDGETAIHNGARNRNTGITNLLIDAGIDINAHNKNGDTALNIAVVNRHTEHVKLLIDAGIDINLRNTGDDKCEPDCPVTTEAFLKEIPSDLHLRRLSLLYNRDEIRQLATHLGLTYAEWENVCDQESQSDEPEKLKFEILRKCRNKFSLTFKSIKNATENANIQNPHTICKVVSGANIDLDDKWDIVPTEEHIDRLAPLIGNSSLQFLIELDMEFDTWEQICHIQADRDLVKLNKNILEEWRNQFCRSHNLKPTLRKIGQAFSNVGKHVKMVENTLSDLF